MKVHQAKAVQRVLCWFGVEWCIIIVLPQHFKCWRENTNPQHFAPARNFSQCYGSLNAQISFNYPGFYLCIAGVTSTIGFTYTCPYFLWLLFMHVHIHRAKRNKGHAPAMGTVKLPRVVCIGTMGFADIFASFIVYDA